jgi:flagellar motor switch protein FliM
METAADNALRRKVAGNRVGRAPIPGIEEIGENFAKLLDERLRGLVRTITSAIVVDCEVRKLSSVLEEIPVPAMIGVIDVRGSQNAALINIGSDLMFHIVDLRMGGDPAAAPTPTARSVTAIDCALCEEFIRLTLEAFEAALRVHLGPGIRSAMRLEHFEQHVTMVRIAPEHSDVLVLRLSLDLGEAARSGDFDLALPLAVLDSYRASAPAGGPSARARSDIWSRRMASAAADAPVRLRAELHRQSLRLAELQELSEGSLLPLPREAREAVALRLEADPEAPPLATGRLGAVDGSKAVKLTETPDAELAEGLRRMLTPGGGRN